jgi:CMP-N-acetylneuraminic acid synthetase
VRPTSIKRDATTAKTTTASIIVTPAFTKTTFLTTITKIKPTAPLKTPP